MWAAAISDSRVLAQLHSSIDELCPDKHVNVTRGGGILWIANIMAAVVCEHKPNTSTAVLMNCAPTINLGAQEEC